MVSDPAEQKQVLDAAKRSGVVVSNPCPSANFTILNQFAIFKPMAFDDSGLPMAGARKQSVAEKGCGQDRLLNVLFWLDPKANSTPLFPGHDTWAAQWPEKNCQIGYIENAEFLKETGEPLEGARGKPWDE